MKIYTKTGDQGTTSLVGGERVAKNDPRVEAYGTVDELTAQIAYLRDTLNMDPKASSLQAFSEDLARILNTLMTLAAVLATGEEGSYKVPDIQNSDIEFLEQRIDQINASLRPIDKFTIPGGHPLVSLSHICRTVCRRAERRTITAAEQFKIQSNVLIYMNRLSDYLYTLGRRLSDEFNVKEIYWIVQK